MGTGTLAFIIFAFVVAQAAVMMGIGIFRQRRKYRNLGSLPGEAYVSFHQKLLAQDCIACHSNPGDKMTMMIRNSPPYSQ
jgi:hypothetical protein